MGYLMENGLPAFPLVPLYGFSQANVAATQSAVALKVFCNEATTGENDVIGIPMPYDGSIVGISVVLSENKTAGTMTFAPTINTTALAAGTGLSAVAMATSAQKATAMIEGQKSGARFVAGDMVGIKITTDGSYTPVTADLFAIVWVVFDGVRI